MVTYRQIVSTLYRYKRPLIVLSVPILLSPLPIALREYQEARCAFLMIMMGVFWATQVVPLPVTGLLPIIFVPLFGIMDARSVTSYYMKDMMMMMIGSLMLSIALERSNVHKRIALHVLMRVGTKPEWIMMGFMLPTWFLSMWVTNTATTAMVMPIVESVIRHMESSTEDVVDTEPGITESGSSDVKMYTWSDINGGIIMESISTRQLNRLRSKRSRRRIAAMSQSALDIRESNVDDDWCEITLDTPPGESRAASRKLNTQLGKCLVLSVAYAANVGGIATLIGTPPNIILKGEADELWQTYGTKSPLTFASWMGYSMPISVIMLVITWAWLLIYFQRMKLFRFCRFCSDSKLPYESDRLQTVIEREYEKLGKIQYTEIITMILFSVMILLLFFREPMIIPGWADAFFKPNGRDKTFVKDDVPVILIAVLLFIIPAKPFRLCRSSEDIFTTRVPQAEPLLRWSTLQEKFPWDLIFVLGGGYALAGASTASGLSACVTDWLPVFKGNEPHDSWLIILVLSLLTAMFTELISNVAATMILLPIVANMAKTLGKSPLFLMLPVTISTSFSFMFPVATPPIAIAFATGRLRVLDTVKVGIFLHVVCVFVVTMATETWGRELFDLDTDPYPGCNATATTSV